MSMFGSMRNGTSIAATGSADSPEYWDDLDERHARHRRHVLVLAALGVLFLALAVVIHPAFAGFDAMLSPFLLMELFMLRQSRPTVKIPDYRPSPTVDVELDDLPGPTSN